MIWPNGIISFHQPLFFPKIFGDFKFQTANHCEVAFSFDQNDPLVPPKTFYYGWSTRTPQGNKALLRAY